MSEQPLYTAPPNGEVPPDFTDSRLTTAAGEKLYFVDPPGVDSIRVTDQIFDDLVAAARKMRAPIRDDAPRSQETFNFALAWLVGVSTAALPEDIPAWGIWSSAT